MTQSVIYPNEFSSHVGITKEQIEEIRRNIIESPAARLCGEKEVESVIATDEGTAAVAAVAAASSAIITSMKPFPYSQSLVDKIAFVSREWIMDSGWGEKKDNLIVNILESNKVPDDYFGPAAIAIALHCTGEYSELIKNKHARQSKIIKLAKQIRVESDYSL